MMLLNNYAHDLKEFGMEVLNLREVKDSYNCNHNIGTSGFTMYSLRKATVKRN